MLTKFSPICFILRRNFLQPWKEKSLKLYVYSSSDWEERKGIQFNLLFEQKYLASCIVFHQIVQSFCCKSDRAHSTWRCAIIYLPVASFTEIKHESPASQVNATLPRVKETLACLKNLFAHCRVRKRNFVKSSYSCNRDSAQHGVRSWRAVEQCPSCCCLLALTEPGRVPGARAGQVLSTPRVPPCQQMSGAERAADTSCV